MHSITKAKLANGGMMFSQSTMEALQYYVYMLVDPRDEKTFYVGKGRNNRVFMHLNGEIDKNELLDAKMEIIQSIRDSGNEVLPYIVRSGLSEKEALLIEQILIDVVPNLTNQVRGHHSEMKLASIVEQEYQAEEIDIPEDVLLININDSYKHGMSEEDRYEATRKWWRMSKKRAETMKCVCCVYKGIIRAVYKIQKWEDWKEGQEEIEARKGRIAFIKDYEKFDSKYIGRAVREYFPRGAQAPFRYGKSPKTT